MIDFPVLESAWALLFILGLRHGLDPDHVAVVDNLTFRAADERPRLAPWVGTLFAIGHSLSVAIVAIIVSSLSGLFEAPAWIGPLVDWAVVGLLLLVGILNLRALRSAATYRPIGWRQGLVPQALRQTSHPAAIIAIGAIFGLVFDTVTQAAAWGAAASAGGGLLETLAVVGVFAAGMILTDTADSQIVARLLRTRGSATRVTRYRRAIGWLIVALSFGMAGYAFLTMLASDYELSDAAFSGLGAAMAGTVILLLWIGRNRGGLRKMGTEGTGH
ncbi:nickel permease [Sphingorhabdus sp.]|jgi:high-affinity nickel-transport protein|uniref:HoxN/HupN/NixA family nickel/cobalt transporter n=1 Tax=Sphingorhabdus sp. TaxID=1902408 RepID=UPI003D81A040